jgi:hypothetical protein
MDVPDRAAGCHILEPLFVASGAAKLYIPAPAIAAVGPAMENVT